MFKIKVWKKNSDLPEEVFGPYGNRGYAIGEAQWTITRGQGDYVEIIDENDNVTDLIKERIVL